MDIFKKKKTIEVDAEELREMHRQLNILQHDYDVLNQEMTDLVKKTARIERKVYRNPETGDQEQKNSVNQFGFWIPNGK